MARLDSLSQWTTHPNLQQAALLCLTCTDQPHHCHRRLQSRVGSVGGREGEGARWAQPPYCTLQRACCQACQTPKNPQSP